MNKIFDMAYNSVEEAIQAQDNELDLAFAKRFWEDQTTLAFVHGYGTFEEFWEAVKEEKPYFYKKWIVEFATSKTRTITTPDGCTYTFEYHVSATGDEDELPKALSAFNEEGLPPHD